jgi:predicted RNA-binding Zn-ribbon protein involved in translation (DUF1610 family)
MKTRTLPLLDETLHLVRCPNCGSIAERSMIEHKLLKTECHSCDYLLISCKTTGKVVESYAPGIMVCHPLPTRITPESGFEYWREAIA